MTQLQRGDGDGANEDVRTPDRVDEEDRADEVQAEEDEGELVGKQKFRMQLAKRMKEDLDVRWSKIWMGNVYWNICVTLHSKDTND